MTDSLTSSPAVVEGCFATDDIAEADAIVRRLYPVASFRDSRGPFALEQTVRGAGGITFARFKTTSWLDIAVELEHVVAYGLVLKGSYAAHSRGEQLDTGRPFLFRPGSAGSTSERLDLVVVNIDLDTLTDRALQWAGADEGRLSLRATSPVSEVMRRHWERTVGYVWRSVLQEPDVLHNDLARTAALESVIAAAMSTFPAEVLASGRSRDSAAVSRSVRMAREFIDQHADAPLTVEAIASEARVSVRALQSAFRRDLDTTPLAYARQVRLARAREQLLDAEPGGVAIADIARRWGFTNLGRFASEYAALFGEKPSRTLRR